MKKKKIKNEIKTMEKKSGSGVDQFLLIDSINAIKNKDLG